MNMERTCVGVHHMTYACKVLEGAAAGFEAPCLSGISFPHDVCTVMLRCRLEGHKRIHTIIVLLLHFHCCFRLSNLKTFTSVCCSFTYLQSASAHAEEVCMPNGSTVREDMGREGIMFSFSVRLTANDEERETSHSLLGNHMLPPKSNLNY